MSVCYVVGAGECRSLPIKKYNGDLIIAADGGLKYLENAGLSADIAIGDFDSLGHTPCGENVIRLKPEKDVTDMYAAVEEGMRRGYENFEIFGATGGRLDHTLANIQLAAFLAKKNLSHRIHGDGYSIVAVDNSSISFDSSFSGYISVFAHSDVCMGVTIEGLKYELNDGRLTNTFSLGVSNEFIGKESRISVEKGILIIIYANKTKENKR